MMKPNLCEKKNIGFPPKRATWEEKSRFFW